MYICCQIIALFLFVWKCICLLSQRILFTFSSVWLIGWLIFSLQGWGGYAYRTLGICRHHSIIFCFPMILLTDRYPSKYCFTKGHPLFCSVSLTAATIFVCISLEKTDIIFLNIASSGSWFPAGSLTTCTLDLTALFSVSLNVSVFSVLSSHYFTVDVVLTHLPIQ